MIQTVTTFTTTCYRYVKSNVESPTNMDASTHPPRYASYTCCRYMCTIKNLYNRLRTCGTREHYRVPPQPDDCVELTPALVVDEEDQTWIQCSLRFWHSFGLQQTMRNTERVLQTHTRVNPMGGVNVNNLYHKPPHRFADPNTKTGRPTGSKVRGSCVLSSRSSVWYGSIINGTLRGHVWYMLAYRARCKSVVINGWVTRH